MDYEKVVVRCSGCGKKMRMVKHSGIKTEGLLCQKCGMNIQKMENEK